MKIEDNNIKFDNLNNITKIFNWVYFQYILLGGTIHEDPDLFDDVVYWPENIQVIEKVTNKIISIRKTDYKIYLSILKTLVIAGKIFVDPDRFRPIDLFEFIYGGSDDPKDQLRLEEMRNEFQPTVQSNIIDDEERSLFTNMVEASSVKEFDKNLVQADELYLLEYLIKSTIISVGSGLMPYDYFNFVESDEAMLFAEKYLTSKEMEEILLYTGLNIIEEDPGRIRFFLGGFYVYCKTHHSDIKAKQITFDFYKYIRTLSNRDKRNKLDYAVVTSLYHQLKSISIVEDDYYPEIINKLEDQDYNFESFRKEMNCRKIPELFAIFLESNIMNEEYFQEIHSRVDNSLEDFPRLSEETLELKFRRFKKP